MHEQNVTLAKRSVKLMGELGANHQDRVSSIMQLFMNLFRIKKEVLYEAVFEAIKSIAQSVDLGEEKDIQKMFD